MYMGKLNNKVDISYTLCRLEAGSVPALRTAGNPFTGETLCIHWDQLMDDTLRMSVDLGMDYMIGDIVIKFADGGTPAAVYIRSEDASRVLASCKGETNCNLSAGEKALTVAESVRHLNIDFVMNFSPLIINGIDIYGAETDSMPMFPIPKSYIRSEGSLPVNMLTKYTADCADGDAAALKFAEKFTECTGLDCERAEDAAFSLILDKNVPTNGYRLEIGTKAASLYASDLRGFVYGTENLIKLMEKDGVPCGTVEDAPFMPYRGVHLMLPGAHEMEFARRLVKYVISPMGYNNIIIEVAGAMRFDSHPEINEAVELANKKYAAGEWPQLPHGCVADYTIVEKKDVAEFVDYIRTFGIEPIPEIQTLGHVQFMTAAHPDIAERDEYAKDVEKVDEMSADVPPIKFYAHCYCPSNEKSYEIALDLLDEIIEVFRPTEFVHMGHDEVYEIGVCPKCREKDPAQLFANDIQRYYDHLKKKGLRMMIWADMVQSATPYKTTAAIDMIPKDIVLLDFVWYFHVDKDIEDNIIGKGFRIGVGNLYSSHYPRYESRIRKPDMIGGQCSTWVNTGEDAVAREGKFYDLIYTANMLWSEEYNSHMRYIYDIKIKSLISEVRANIRGEAPLTGERKSLYTRKLSLPGAKYVTVELTADDCFTALVFTHTASNKRHRIPWLPNTVIASYEITYKDGTTETVPLAYGSSICHYARRQNEPFKSPYYRHNGYCGTYFADGIESKAEDGSPITMYRQTWYNPKPEAAIIGIKLIPEANVGTDVLVSDIVGVK